VSSRTLTSTAVPKTYAELRRAVEVTMVRGQREADLARVRTYHETGRLIRAHVLLFKERADYGARTIRCLGEDLGIDRSVLHRCVRFAECFPIVATWPQLTWAHFRMLIPIEDRQLRQALATEADKYEWPVARLELRLRAQLPLAPSVPDQARSATPPKPLTPKRGVPGLHMVVERDGQPAVDLGFKLLRPLAADSSRRFARGDLADVFLDSGNGETVFLNNELLAHGHAIRKDEYALTDWEGGG